MSSLTESMSCDWYSAMAPAEQRGQRKASSSGEDGPTSDLRPHEQGVELGEDAEHLVRVLGATEAVAEARDDVVLDTGDALVVARLGCDPDLRAVCRSAGSVRIRSDEKEKAHHPRRRGRRCP